MIANKAKLAADHVSTLKNDANHFKLAVILRSLNVADSDDTGSSPLEGSSHLSWQWSFITYISLYVIIHF